MIALSSPAFSVIIINYNYAAFLGQAIDSALAQSLPDCEVIVVDDKSTDGSRELIQTYGDRIAAVFRTTNGGMSAAVNSGFERSSGEIVLFLDADDFLYPHAAALIAKVWSPNTAQVQARLEVIDVHGNVEDIFPAPEMRFDVGDVTPALAYRGRYSTTVTSGLAFSRAALNAVLPIPEKAFDRSADGYLATVVPLYGRVEAIEFPIGAYRRHDSNHSGFNADIAKRARWRVDHDEHRYAALRDHAPQRGIKLDAAPGLHDAVHLEQRLASLCFEPGLHPYPADNRWSLALAGARAAFSAPMSAKRRAVYCAMFVVAGITPLFLARRALAWKLERSSRPAAIDRIIGRIRRFLG